MEALEVCVRDSHVFVCGSKKVVCDEALIKYALLERGSQRCYIILLAPIQA